MLQNTYDLYPQGTKKVMCSAGGVVAPVRFRWRPACQEHFTGMFGCAEHGIIRCSSVVEPVKPSALSPWPPLLPLVALKFFRDGSAPSANLSLAYRKTGARTTNFLASPFSNHLTENVAYPFKTLLSVFQKCSKYATFLGLHAFAERGQDGHAPETPRAPYALMLVAPAELRQRKVQATSHLIEQFKDLQAGQVLFEVYAVPEPLRKPWEKGNAGTRSATWRVGELLLTDAFRSSKLGDERLFFRHHTFEEDLRHRAEWESKVDTNLGTEFYHERVTAGDLWDAPRGEETLVPKAPTSGGPSSSCFSGADFHASEAECRLPPSVCPMFSGAPA